VGGCPDPRRHDRSHLRPGIPSYPGSLRLAVKSSRNAVQRSWSPRRSFPYPRLARDDGQASSLLEAVTHERLRLTHTLHHLRTRSTECRRRGVSDDQFRRSARRLRRNLLRRSAAVCHRRTQSRLPPHVRRNHPIVAVDSSFPHQEQARKRAYERCCLQGLQLRSCVSTRRPASDPCGCTLSSSSKQTETLNHAAIILT
jgi:hypothetical protein